MITRLLEAVRDELGPIYYEVLYAGHFDGAAHFAVYVLRKNCNLEQLPKTVRTVAAECNELAKRAAEQAGCDWYGYAGDM